MREFQDKRRFKKLMHSRYVIVALIIICVLLGRAVFSVYEKYDRSKDIADRAQNELLLLSAREQSLNKEIINLGTELGKEKEVRERFGVVKEGERMIVLVDDKSSEKSNIILVKDGWWQKFIGFFSFSNLRD